MIKILAMVVLLCVLGSGPAITESPLQWVLQDSINRLEAGDVWGAIEQYKLAIAVEPISTDLDRFPVGKLPLFLAGDVLLYNANLLALEPQRATLGWEKILLEGETPVVYGAEEEIEVRKILSLGGHSLDSKEALLEVLQVLPTYQGVGITLETTDGRVVDLSVSLSMCYEDSQVLNSLIKVWWEYGIYAVVVGQYHLAEEAALAIETLYYSHYNDPGLDLDLLQAAPALLRTLSDAYQDSQTSPWRLRANKRQILAVWPQLESHVLRYPEYWHPFLQQPDLVEVLPLDHSKLVFADNLVRNENKKAYPNIQGQLEGEGLGELWYEEQELLAEEVRWGDITELWNEAVFFYEEWLLYGDIDSFEAALMRSLTLTEWDPELVGGWFLTAQLLSELKDNLEAMEWATDALIHALDLEPDLLEAQLLLGQVLLEQGRFFSAADQFKFVIERFGEDVVTGLVTTPLALAYVADGRVKAGIIYFQNLQERFDKPCLHLALAVLNGHEENWDSTFLHLDEVLNHPLASDNEKEYAEILRAEYVTLR